MTSSVAADRRIRSIRPPKPPVDAWRAHGSRIEEERRPGGVVEKGLTIFLAGAECPFTCAFCDLWRYTIDGPTPEGALPKQIADTLASLERPLPDRIKLYNASNFFDRRAVPSADVGRIAELCAPFGGVTVEAHASLVGDWTARFARQLRGRLEVAIGLETIHPGAIEHLNKRMELAQFDAAARFLADNDIDLRVFVLLGAPYVPVGESVEWTVRTVEYAAQRGAALVSIIPVRGGNGELERLKSIGQFTPPTRRQLDDAVAACAQILGPVITADLWDIDRLPA